MIAIHSKNPDLRLSSSSNRGSIQRQIESSQRSNITTDMFVYVSVNGLPTTKRMLGSRTPLLYLSHAQSNDGFSSESQHGKNNIFKSEIRKI